MRAPNIPITSLTPPEEVRKAGKTSLGLKQDVTACTNSDAIPQPRAQGEGAAACKRGVPKKSVSSAFWEEAGVITDFLISQEPSSPLFCVRVIRSGRQRRCVVSPRVSRRGARSFKGQNGAWEGEEWVCCRAQKLTHSSFSSRTSFGEVWKSAAFFSGAA